MFGVYMCMCTYVFTVQGPVCVRSEVNFRYLSSHSLSYCYYDFLRQGLSLSLKLVDWLDWMTGLVLGIPLALPPGAGITARPSKGSVFIVAPANLHVPRADSVKYLNFLPLFQE